MAFSSVKNINRVTQSCSRLGVILVISACVGMVSNSHSCTLSKNGEVPELIYPRKYMSYTPGEEYGFKLIQVLIKASEDKYGPCRVRLYKHNIPARRIELYLENNEKIHVTSLTVKEERTARFRVIPIPIAKGMVGIRVLLVRKEEQYRFSNITDIQGLRGFVAGQGNGWLDTKVLKYNGLKVLTTDDVHHLQGMLVAKRFDYYPLGALGYRIKKQLPIAVESKLILSYPNMTAFYVNKNNTALAERIRYGLHKIIFSGELDQLFYTHPDIKSTLDYLDMKNRVFIHLCNPFIPDWMPLETDEYWLRPWSKGACKNSSVNKTTQANPI